MPFVTTHPEAMAAAGDLHGIGSQTAAGNSVAAGPTTGVVSAAADEESAITAAHFVANSQMYQAAGAQAAAIHQVFVSTLGTCSEPYPGTDIANATIAQ